MSNYTAETVEPLLAEMLQTVEDALSLAKSAGDELAALKAAQAAPVVLEKVASIPDEEINATLDTLQENGFLDAKDAAGVAAAVKADPSVALKIASRIATLSAATSSQGAGVAKTASAETSTDKSKPEGWEADGWDKVAEGSN